MTTDLQRLAERIIRELGYGYANTLPPDDSHGMAWLESLLSEAMDRKVTEAIEVYSVGCREVLKSKMNEAYTRAAEVAKAMYPKGKAHTYASKNADVYRAQENACLRIAAIERLRDEKD